MTKSAEAIRYLLKRIQADGRLAWIISPETETFSLLTEAFAEEAGKDVNEFKQQYAKSLHPVRVPRLVDLECGEEF